MAENGPFGRLKEAIERLLDRLRGKQETEATGDSPLTWPKDEKHRVAVHEAGHGVVAWTSATVTEVSSIVVSPGGNGRTVWAGSSLLGSGHPLALWERCAVCFGGIAGEAFTYGNYYRNGSMFDMQQALAVANQLAAAALLYPSVLASPWGQPEPALLNDFGNIYVIRLPSPQADILYAAYYHACMMVVVNKSKLLALAAAAAKHRTLNAKDISRVLGPRPWALP